MTKIKNEKVICDKCGKESEQAVVYSVNFLLGKKEDNKKLMNHKQICPHCNYTAAMINKNKK